MRFYVSPYAADYELRRVSFEEKTILSATFFKTLQSKHILARHYLSNTDGSRSLTVWELRSKRRGLYGYTFDVLVEVYENRHSTYYKGNRGEIYRTGAFLGVTQKMGFDLYHNGQRYTAHPDPSTLLPALFKAALPGAELDVEQSYSSHDLN